MQAARGRGHSRRRHVGAWLHVMSIRCDARAKLARAHRRRKIIACAVDIPQHAAHAHANEALIT